MYRERRVSLMMCDYDELKEAAELLGRLQDALWDDGLVLTFSGEDSNVETANDKPRVCPAYVNIEDRDGACRGRGGNIRDALRDL